MKNITIKVLSLLIATTGLFASCSQEELVKADFDRDNVVAASELPTIVSIDTVSVDAFNATLDITIKGGFDNILELAIVFADNDSLKNASASFVYTEDLMSQIPDSVVVNKEEGYTFRVPVTGLLQNTHYYLSAYAVVNGQSPVKYEGELCELTTDVAYALYGKGTFASPMFGASWENDIEKHLFVENIYRLPSYIAQGYDLEFYWDEETNEVAFTSAQWETGYNHPTYGMISAKAVDISYDPATSTFTFVVEYVVAAGSFGTIADTYTLSEKV